MHFSGSNRALLHSMMASVLVLAGTTACSRSDRSETGSDNSAAVIQDTVSTAPDQGSGSSTTAGTSTETDTTTAIGTGTKSGAATGDTAPARIQSDAPRAATALPSAERQDTSLQGDSTAAGYRAMERDTGSVPESDSARVTEDTSETSLNTAARVDTSSADAQVTADADVSANADVAVGEADTAGNAGRIRPPEDSTEILGEVVTSETADEEPVNADEQEINADDGKTVATSESPADEVGAAAIGGSVTGAEAVALMTRQGVRCSMVDPESNQEVRWDMSSTPVTLNPCGLGSMVLSRIWTEGSAGQE